MPLTATWIYRTLRRVPRDACANIPAADAFAGAGPAAAPISRVTSCSAAESAAVLAEGHGTGCPRPAAGRRPVSATTLSSWIRPRTPRGRTGRHREARVSPRGLALRSLLPVAHSALTCSSLPRRCTAMPWCVRKCPYCYFFAEHAAAAVRGRVCAGRRLGSTALAWGARAQPCSSWRHRACPGHAIDAFCRRRCAAAVRAVLEVAGLQPGHAEHGRFGITAPPCVNRLSSASNLLRRRSAALGLHDAADADARCPGTVAATTISTST